MKPDRLCKYYLLRLRRLQGNPQYLAVGFALGVFVGFTPTMPFHTPLILLLTTLTRSSFIAGIISSWLVCNPLTFGPIYYISLHIGNLVTPYHLNWPSFHSVLLEAQGSGSFIQMAQVMADLGGEVLTMLVAGGILLAIPFSIASYYGSLRFFLAVDQKRRKRPDLN